MCLASTIQSIPAGQPVKVFFGLKRSQWPQKRLYQQLARNCLDGLGVNVPEVRCFLKTTTGAKPKIDPDYVNLFIHINGQNTIDVVV